MLRRKLVAVTMLTLSAQVAWAQAPAGPPAFAPPPPEPLSGAVITTQGGRVQGFEKNGVAVFRGLPFAAPPVGALRWRPPEYPAKWSEVRPANAFSGACNQTEDCLYLNVFAPAGAQETARLPVFLFIHGGGFAGGSGAGFDGSEFVKRGVIVVTVNYRLGRAGWFAHPALSREKGPFANYGLMDQIAALEWVRDNIGHFGGNKNNVTIGGGSAGAISVNYLMLAPKAKGLFAKAVSESGFGRMIPPPLYSRPNGARSAEAMGTAFAERLGIQGDDAAAAKALRALSLADLQGNVGAIGSSDDRPLPIADGTLIAASAYDGFWKGREARVPYLVGGNSDEASLTRRNTKSAAVLAGVTERRDEFMSLYDPDKSGDTDRIVARLITDQSIGEPNRALARFHSKNGAPTFVYHFSYVPQATRSTAFGMGHGAETAYVFATPRTNNPFDDEGKAVAAAANSYWAQFAKTGDPGSAGGTVWPKFSPKQQLLLDFGVGPPQVREDFQLSRLDWVEQGLKQ